MNLGKTLLGALGIRAGEASRVAWLVAHSLFIGLFSAFFLTASNALFLARFEISFLPLAYIATAVVGYFALMLFSRLQKKVPLPRVLVLNLVFLFVVAAALWLLALATGSRWVAFLMFVWVGPAFSLLALGYWALAGRLFDLRQGKRLFGLVGAGEEVSTVVGLFSVPVLVRLLGGPSRLLPIALVGLVGCLAVVAAINRRFADTLAASHEERRAAAEERRSGLAQLLRSRYFLLLAALIIFLNLANYIVDFSFLSQVRGRFQGPTAIAQFIGIFFGVTKILELLAKVFLSGRLLSQFGLKFGLMAVPTLLLACGGFAIAIGTLGLSATSFFVLVALAKLVWLVSRTTTFEPTFRVFYQPVRGVDRLAFQTHVEGTARQLAIGVVGVALLLFSRSPAFNALTLFYALVPLLALWIVTNLAAHRDYRSKLMESLTARGRKEGGAQALDVLKPLLGAGDPQQRAQAFDLLEKIEGAALFPTLAEMLADPSPALRVAALEHVARERLADLQEWVSGCLSDADPMVQRAARDTLDRLREVEAAGATAERILGLSESTEPGDRVLAAEAIGRSGERAERLWVLLFDAEWTVRRAALAAAGRLGRPEFWPQLIGELESPVLSSTAAAALVALGERALPEAERAFNKADQAPRVRQRILEIYEAVGGPKAQALLANKLAFPDAGVRAQALVALSRAGYQADAASAPLVARAIETLVGRTAWNMSAVLDLGDDPRVLPVVRALEEEIEAARSRLFELLSLVHDPWAIGIVRESIESGSSETIVYALEILDLLLSDELKHLVFPLVEGLGYPQVLRRLEATCPRHRLERAERLSLIVNRDFDKIDSWTRACALAALGQIGGAEVPDLVASLYHPDPLMHELAALTLLRQDAQAYARQQTKLSYDAREKLAYVLGPDGTTASWDSRSVYGRVQLLRGIPAFSALPSLALLRLARVAEELVLNPRRRLPSPRAPRESFYVNVDGAQALADGGAPRRTLPRLSLIAFGPGASSIEVIETSRFVRIDPDQLFDLAGEHVALIPPLLQARQQLFDGQAVTVAPEPSPASPRLAVAGA
jgi:ATP:ADP antiporter, AAA family